MTGGSLQMIPSVIRLARYFVHNQVFVPIVVAISDILAFPEAIAVTIAL